MLALAAPVAAECPALGNNTYDLHQYVMQGLQNMNTEASTLSVTGRDHYIVVDALATALVALEQLPPEKQPESNMEDMNALLAAWASSATVSFMLAQAKCRMRHNLDFREVYREYRISSNG
jgi:hypothetical protein